MSEEEIGKLIDNILEYFDHYKLATVTPIFVTLEKAFLAKDSAVERLTKENELLKAANASFEGGMHWRNGIISELADALENHNLDHLQDDLIQRAREAAKHE